MSYYSVSVPYARNECNSTLVLILAKYDFNCCTRDQYAEDSHGRRSRDSND
jgi:hypothetical protein